MIDDRWKEGTRVRWGDQRTKNPNSSLPNGKTAAKLAVERNYQDILNVFEINQALNDSFCYSMFKDIYVNRKWMIITQNEIAR